MEPSKQTLLVAGLVVDVYSHPSATDPTVPVHALFFLHGRTGSSQGRDVVTTMKAIFDVTYGSDASPRKKDLIVVSFVSHLELSRSLPYYGYAGHQDHRNHGTRLVDMRRNLGWNEHPEHKNDQHAYVARVFQCDWY